MNDFSMVSADELNQVEGGQGHWYNKVGDFLEKVAVAVVSAIIIKKL